MTVGDPGQDAPMRCQVCGATDNETPIVAFAVKVDGHDDSTMVARCGRHVFQGAPE